MAGLPGLSRVITAASKAGAPNPVYSSVLGSSIASLIPALMQGLLGQGGALRSAPSQGGTGSKFTIPMADVQNLYRFVEKENKLRAAANAAGANYEFLDVDDILDKTIARNNAALEEASRREAYIARVKGEQLNIGQGLASLGNLGQERERTLQTAISKVLAQDPVGSNQALANLSRGF
jgi:hypothetical protein